MLSVAQAPVVLPMPTAVFAALSALLFVGAGALLRADSRTTLVSGWLVLALPIHLFVLAQLSAPGIVLTRAAGHFLAGLMLSATGVIIFSFVPVPVRSPHVRHEPDDAALVDELFALLERAEQSEIRVAELERQLRSQAHGYDA